MISKTDAYTDLVPDYLAGTLSPRTRKKFERAMAVNPALRQEVDEFLSFQNLYLRIMPVPPAPSEEIFEKIITSVDSQDTPHQPYFHRRVFFPAFRRLWSQIRNSPTIAWGVAAIQATVIVLLLLPGDYFETRYYRTLGTPPVLPKTGSKEFTVIFASDCTESQMRDFLLNIKGSILKGPSPEGRYLITIPAGQSDIRQAATQAGTRVILFEAVK